ncbi:hypothetical protein [Methylobacterium nigriterrae]|uniref:hypothetical protein n=1 Tax=Methylobacterium nigriterrae TaxID=3127512 RepID=UPI00301396E4
MEQTAGNRDAASPGQGGPAPVLSFDTRQRLGLALRSVYEGSVDTQPIPDTQVDLLLRLRHKERERSRAR